MTIGIEVEFIASIQEDVRDMFRGWSVVGDGSVRRHLDSLTEDLRYASSRREVGGELVSGIIKTKDLVKELAPVLNFLERVGEVAYGANSIHIHTHPEYQWFYKSIPEVYKYFLEYESFFFNLATERGVEFRGKLNDSIYCRPIKSPQYIPYEGSWWPSLGKIENVTCKEDLIYTLGRLNTASNKWYPPRYVGINFVPLIRQGTLEYRMFNFSTNLDYVVGVALICEATTKQVFRKNYCHPYEALEILCKENKLPFRLYQEVLEYNTTEVYAGINLRPTKSHTPHSISWGNSCTLDPEPVGYAYEVKTVHPFEPLVKPPYIIDLRGAEHV